MQACTSATDHRVLRTPDTILQSLWSLFAMTPVCAFWPPSVTLLLCLLTHVWHNRLIAELRASTGPREVTLPGVTLENLRTNPKSAESTETETALFSADLLPKSASEQNSHCVLFSMSKLRLSTQPPLPGQAALVW